MKNRRLELRAELAEFVRAEREMEEALVWQKAAYLGRLARGEVGTTDEATKKPKRDGKDQTADRRTIMNEDAHSNETPTLF
jgi:hypothetical protein